MYIGELNAKGIIYYLLSLQHPKVDYLRVFVAKIKAKKIGAQKFVLF